MRIVKGLGGIVVIVTIYLVVTYLQILLEHGVKGGVLTALAFSMLIAGFMVVLTYFNLVIHRG